MAFIPALTESPTVQNIEAFYEKVKTFQPWSGNPYGWGAQFTLDSAMNWIGGNRPVDDL